MKNIIFGMCLLLSSCNPAYADTPPLRTQFSYLYDSVGNGLTSDLISTKRGLDEYNINPLTAPANTQIIVGGAAIDPRTGLDVSNTGTLTAAGQTVQITPTPGSSSWSIQIGGTFSAGSTITWEVSDDAVTWTAVNGRQTGTGTGISILGTSVSGPGSFFYRGNLAGSGYFRARCSAFASGDSITVIVKSAQGVGAIFLNSALPPGVNSIGTVATKTALNANAPGVVTIGTSTTVLLAANASRTGLAITNISSNTIYLGFGVSAVLGSGIALLPGGVFTMDEYSFYRGAINAISAVSSQLNYQEFQ
jgi:hypothetical protein